jgi:GGDEF domain-containing protein
MLGAGAIIMRRINWWELQRQPTNVDRFVPGLYSITPGFAVISFAVLAVIASLSAQPNWIAAVGVGISGVLLAIRIAHTAVHTERLVWRTYERDRLESVLEASVTIANTTDLDALLERVAEVSANATRSTRAQIRIYNDDRSRIEAMGGFGLSSTERAIAGRLASVPVALIPGERHALDTLMPKVQRSDDPQLLPEVQGLLQACGKDVSLIAPLIADRKVLGVIETWSPSRTEDFEPVDLAALAVIGQEAGIALQNTRLLKELNWRANHDGLTGLHNHRSAVETLEQALDAALEEATPLSILISDIDNFKQINDSYGHLLGDQVLTELSQALKDMLKPVETAGRYGGDEFLVILPGRNSRQAESLSLQFCSIAQEQIS